jgi:hypothetical protein
MGYASVRDAECQQVRIATRRNTMMVDFHTIQQQRIILKRLFSIMPHGNKKPRNKNNKKKKGRAAGHGSGPGGPAMGGHQKSDSTTTAAAAFGPLGLNDIPEWVKRDGTPKPLDQDYSSVYMRYKRATIRFQQALQSKVPGHIYGEGATKQIMDSVDYLACNEDIFVESTLMHDLKLALRVRKRVAQSMMGGGDEGHAYFNCILAYSWGKLRRKWKAQRNVPESRRQQTPTAAPSYEEDTFVNRFSVLSDDDIEEDEQDEAWFPTNEIPRPATSKPELRDITLEDIVHGDDRQAVILFFLSLDELMGHNVDQYSKLKHEFQDNQREQLPANVIAVHLMEAAAGSNFAIDQVSMLEQQLMIEYPHLNTVYKVLALLVMPACIQHVAQEVKTNSPRASDFDAQKDAVEFLGDCVEVGFRNASDPQNRGATLATDFCRCWGISIPNANVEKLAEAAKYLVAVEVPFELERAQNQAFYQRIEGIPEMPQPNSWLNFCTFLGKGRNLVNTIKLLQRLSNIIGENDGILIPAKKGWFGRPWDEQRKARNITGDMDEFLMADVLPSLIAMCSKGLLATDVPRQSEILPFFSHLRSYCDNPEKPVSFALAFGVHTLLTSVYEVQGNGDVHSLGTTAKLIWDNYMVQLETANKESETPRDKHWKYNVEQMSKIKWLLVLPPRIATESQILRAIWNPMTAGSFLLYLSYQVNLDCGTAMIDSMAQLRIVLHLYNALCQVGAMVPHSDKQLRLLDTLNDSFKGSKAIWEGSILPKRGEFAKRFLIAFGFSIKEAQRQTEEIRAGLSGGRNASSSSKTNSKATKNMTPIHPHQISKSFRRICLRDFSDVVDKYHTEKQKRDGRVHPCYAHAVRVNDTLDALVEEQDLLALNLTSVGDTLNHFIDHLFKILELKPMVDKFVREIDHEGGRRMTGSKFVYTPWEDENAERVAQVSIFAEKILGMLDFVDAPLEVPALARTTAVLQMYFSSQVDPSNILWFSPLVTE